MTTYQALLAYRASMRSALSAIRHSRSHSRRSRFAARSLSSAACAARSWGERKHPLMLG